jgi:hypothetical protein
MHTEPYEWDIGMGYVKDLVSCNHAEAQNANAAHPALSLVFTFTS